jgi:hypothetical protein
MEKFGGFLIFLSAALQNPENRPRHGASHLDDPQEKIAESTSAAARHSLSSPPARDSCRI